ncbi:uncharacterized protein EDB91DRAFT_1237547 [Suillus paluster]|uniref:uncharacterized protein n=1 Tax=Suillus paluster TaxID=48578 RepID=UPI001B87B029|nr:uncharacterized protein EDB91DRAFT_1237547 [Suillus paluster]KAG1739490.1 hypothetical protein EDB91DRAFT_1237547 [Suillus paluster]
MSDVALLPLQVPLKRQCLNSGADWEAGIARVTASTGLLLQWVENTEWLKLCDRFIPHAKVSSAKVLTKHVIPQVLHDIKGSAKEECHGAVGTLQCDRWTGENSHHLFELLKQMIKSINQVKCEWGVTIIACTTDASRESCKAWQLLCARFLHLVTPDCLAHQIDY